MWICYFNTWHKKGENLEPTWAAKSKDANPGSQKLGTGTPIIGEFMQEYTWSVIPARKCSKHRVFYGITNMNIRIPSLYVKNAINALCLKASIEYIDELTYIVEYTNALQGPVAKNINGHRTCIGTYKCTSIVNMYVRCVITPTCRSTSSDGISENTEIPHIINVKIACSNASITHS